MSEDQIQEFQTWAKENTAGEKPIVVLPSGNVTISECAENLFELIAPTKTLFVRGGAVVVLKERDDGIQALDILRPAAARSLFEKHARLGAWRSGNDGKMVLKPICCPKDTADALLLTDEAQRLLPRIAGLINCPIIRVVDGVAAISGKGYDTHTRLLVTGGGAIPDVELADAVPALLSLFSEFDFQSDGDKSRALTALISPALKMGGFIKGRLPADVAEADQSQSGKTYRQKVVAAVYNEMVSLVTSREGGVGSVDESLNQQLIAGRPFIQFDNFRGRFDSSHLEAFLTAEGEFPCRVPHRGEVTVPAENYFVMLTSNGVHTTRDFANRSNIIRIRKKPPGFVFKKYAEGDLLAHVRAQQSYYLGCIFAVIRHWHAQGHPRTDETRHDFKDWVQVVDWIVQQVFGLAPVMDGHQEAQERVSNPALVWLRSVVLAVDQMGELNREFTATDLHSLCENGGIVVSGLREGADEDTAKRIIGRVMAKLFGQSNTVDVEGYRVVRAERCVDREGGGSYPVKIYTLRKQ